jgi:hypothetical protein
MATAAEARTREVSLAWTDQRALITNACFDFLSNPSAS